MSKKKRFEDIVLLLKEEEDLPLSFWNELNNFLTASRFELDEISFKDLKIKHHSFLKERAELKEIRNKIGQLKGEILVKLYGLWEVAESQIEKSQSALNKRKEELQQKSSDLDQIKSELEAKKIELREMESQKKRGDAWIKVLGVVIAALIGGGVSIYLNWIDFQRKIPEPYKYKVALTYFEDDQLKGWPDSLADLCLYVGGERHFYPVRDNHVSIQSIVPLDTDSTSASLTLWDTTFMICGTENGPLEFDLHEERETKILICRREQTISPDPLPNSPRQNPPPSKPRPLVEARVVDAQTGLGIEGATIEVIHPGRGQELIGRATSGPNGHFSIISEIPKSQLTSLGGKYDFVIIKEGYQKIQEYAKPKTFNLKKDQ
jgi:hypothetical protein